MSGACAIAKNGKGQVMMVKDRGGGGGGGVVHREVPMVDRRKISSVGREVSRLFVRILSSSSLFHVLYGSLFLPQAHSAISSRKTPQREQINCLHSSTAMSAITRPPSPLELKSCSYVSWILQYRVH
ncbi:hypothetical protein GX48_00935 [Paracoccidioides brasiliensis]|nr:hypothetical protein GX48_00935 [Paracoccidioides brasiliensis]